MNPPREISWTEVPEELRSVLETSFPGFTVGAVKHHPVAQEYKLKGSYRERQANVELEYGSKEILREIEYEDSRAGAGVTRPEDCELSDLSAEAMTHFHELLGSEHESFRTTRVSKGSFSNEAAFKVKGISQYWRWEFEIAGDGTLIELEKTVV